MRVTLDTGRVIENVTMFGSDFGKLYLVGKSDGCWESWFLTRETDLESAIDALVESDHGESLRISEDEMSDYLGADVVVDGEFYYDYAFTGSGIAYDTDWLLIGPENAIRKVELEPADWATFPKVFEDQGEAREAIRLGFGRAALALDYADAIESDSSLPSIQGDVYDCLPEETPAYYLRWAERSIRAIEESLGFGIVEAFHRAIAVPCVNSWETGCGADDLDDVEEYGRLVAMQFVGTGVSWSDDHPELPYSLPLGEQPMAFLVGDLNLDDLDDNL